MRNSILFSFVFFLQVFGFSQCMPSSSNCASGVNPMIPETDNVDFLFDSFSQYQGGIYQYGKTILKLKVDDNLGFTCRWKLSMIVSNNGWINTDQWNTLATYSAGSGSNPTLDLLEIRVTNSCGTPDPTVYNIWRSFAIPPGTGDAINIINDPFPNPVTPGGSCASQVNGAGTYLGPNYGEYSFTIDYRIIPGVNWIPGYYNLSVKFCLTE